jgi:hypothetical protein
MLQSRRAFLRGFIAGGGASLIAAPAIVRAVSLMPVRGIIQPVSLQGVPLTFDGGYPMLADITREAFLPRLFVQVYQQSPLDWLINELEQERAAG